MGPNYSLKRTAAYWRLCYHTVRGSGRLAQALCGKPARLYTCYMKVSEMLRLLHDDGWFLVATRGSHRQYKHSSKAGRVTVPGKPSDDLAAGTLNSILKQAGLKR